MEGFKNILLFFFNHKAQGLVKKKFCFSAVYLKASFLLHLFSYSVLDNFIFLKLKKKY